VTNIRLLPIVIMAVAALLVLKTMGIVTNGGYVLTGIATAEAAGSGGSSAPATATASGSTVTIPSEPTIEDQTPILADSVPTLGGNSSNSGGHGASPGSEASSTAGHGDAPSSSESAEPASDASGGHGEEATNSVVAANACDPVPALSSPEPGADGQLMILSGECPPLTDARPQVVTTEGIVPLAGNSTSTEDVLLDRLATRRTDLDAYEQELAMRASLVEAAEKRIEERQAAMQAIEDQIASLVEQRKQMEEGQFASIVAMYETMKPKDAAKIFDNLDIEVLLRVSKMMSPRKMAPILAAMTTSRAQELTVRMASADADPLETMSSDDIAALPQIVGQ